jgi:hypothetical protein
VAGQCYVLKQVHVEENVSELQKHARCSQPIDPH